MCTFKALGITLGLFCVVNLAVAAETPELGETLSVRGLTVFPNGDGLPEGAGSAVEGEAVYQRQCLACHGLAGEGGINDRLAGGQGTLKTLQPLQTVGSYWPYATTLFDYRRPRGSTGRRTSSRMPTSRWPATRRPCVCLRAMP